MWTKWFLLYGENCFDNNHPIIFNDCAYLDIGMMKWNINDWTNLELGILFKIQVKSFHLKKMKFYRVPICLKMLDSDFVPETGIFEIQNSLAVDLRVAYFRDWFDECFLYENKMWWKWLDQLCNVIIFVTELCNLFFVKLYSPQFDENNLKRMLFLHRKLYLKNPNWKSYADPVFT